jgi:hypothetical protein
MALRPASRSRWPARPGGSAPPRNTLAAGVAKFYNAGYDQHGRITSGEPEQMMDAAAAAYVAVTLDGADTLLMAAEHGLRRELSRRIPASPVIVQSTPVSSFASRTAACTIDSPRSMAPPGTAQLWLSERRMSKTSPTRLVTTTLTEGTRLFAEGRGGVVVEVDSASHVS